MKKKLSTIIFLLFFSTCVFGHTGVLSGEGKLKVIKTQYFDIIYSPVSERSAIKIASVCDGYYLELTSLLGCEPYKRFPVTITHSVEDLNAYFTALPYNRIVLYDTLPSSSLDMNSNTLEKVFYHELTHAVTLNIEGPKVKKVTAVFGDFFNPAWINFTSFWNEGATVSLESVDGDGRLNDPYSTLIVNQSKIENDFPSWRDVTGARDTYPGGTDAYMFGGEFAKYLQTTYGYEKYGELWLNAGSKLSLSFCSGIFKKTYGKKIDQVWKEFEQSIDTIPVADDKEYLCEDLTKKINKHKPVYKYIDSDGKSIVFYDRKTSTIYSYDGNKVKKLFCCTNVSKLAVSRDGRYVCVSHFKTKDTVRSEVFIYDIKKGSILKLNEEGCRDPFFVYKDGCTYLGCVKSSSTPVELLTYRIDFEKNDFVKDCSLKLKEDVVPFSPVGFENGHVAFISKDKMVWSISVYNVFEADKGVKNYFIDDSVNPYIFHNLHYAGAGYENNGKNVFTFSYAQMGKAHQMLPRNGYFTLEGNEGAFSLCDQNVSGGITDAVLYKGSLVYLSEYYESTKLKKRDELYFTYTSVETCKDLYMADVEKETVKKAEDNFNVCKYNGFSYAKKGILAPVSSVSIYDDDLSLCESSFAGLSYLTGNPWNGTLYTTSAGYDFMSKSFGGFEQIKIDNGKTNITFSLTGLFDSNGFTQSVQSVDYSTFVYQGLISNISLGITGSNLSKESAFSEEYSGIAYTQFSNVHKYKSYYGCKTGFYIKPYIIKQWNYINAGSSAGFYVPFALPFHFYGSLYPSKKYVLNGGLSCILFSHEIQKGIKGAALYAERVLFSAGYSGKVKYNHKKYWDVLNTADILNEMKKDDYSDTASVSMGLQVSPNASFFASGNYSYDFEVSMLYHINTLDNQKKLGCSVSAVVAY